MPTPASTATPTPTPTVSPASPLMLMGAGTPTEPPPAALVSAQYIYDGDNNLVKAVVNGVVTYYPGRHYNLEVDGETETVKKFYAVGNLTIAVRTVVGEQDTLHWILSDHLGSLNVTANEDGSWNSEIRYTAFGEVRWKDGLTPTDYRFTGQLEQSYIKLYWYNSRWMDNELAHFVQADTIVPDQKNIKTWNRYSYTLYNPIRFNDPSGHDVGCPGMDASKCRQGYGVSKAVLTQVWKEEAVETANKYLEKRQEGTTVNWNGLPSQEKSILERGGYNEDIYNDHIQPALLKADPWHDPLTYITLLAGGASLGKSAIKTIIGYEVTDCSIDGQCLATHWGNNRGATGNLGEQILQLAGGDSQVYFKTTQGGRYIDQLINRMAYESKVGYVPLTQNISLQVSKDVELLNIGVVDQVTWVFFKSPITGLSGPSEPLYQLLTQNGISVMFGQ